MNTLAAIILFFVFLVVLPVAFGVFVVLGVLSAAGWLLAGLVAAVTRLLYWIKS